jgi:hypothetical protein
MTFTLDSLHADWLPCDHCGRLLGRVGPAEEDPAVLVCITGDQLVPRRPHYAADVGLHGSASPALPGPTWEECEGWAAPP